MWNDPELIKSLQKIALSNVLNQSVDFFIERCYRYYSKTYCTPLNEVKKSLTPAHVMLIFFEDHYNQLPAEEIIQLRDKILKAPSPIYPNEDLLSDSNDDIDEDEDLQQFIDNILKEEERQKELHVNKNINENIQKDLDEKLKNQGISISEGSINFSDLE